MQEWGFFAHKSINKYAVYTLPSDLLKIYKPNIHFISEHAVDPDKRRFALKNEAYRHYIDIDHWGEIKEVPRDLQKAIRTYGKCYCMNKAKDTIRWVPHLSEFDTLYEKHIHDGRFSTEIELPDREGYRCTFSNELIKYGVLPYFLEHHYDNLVKAFASKSLNSILKLSADIGHYLGDAHVPLHTTENYNGQLTDQLGIHAFWESRLPELYAAEEFDFLVGKAEYIIDKKEFFWETIFHSHSLLEQVLGNEKSLSESFDEDKQYCYDNRNDRTIWTQCPEYARAYFESMGNMVEDQMRKSIIALGSIWYSAWIDAGQPDIDVIIDDVDKEAVMAEKKKLDNAVKNNAIYGRNHG